MKFLGEIIQMPEINHFKFHRAMRDNPMRIVLTSDFETEYTICYARVYGKFDNDFCSGLNPLMIKENGIKEIEADIQLSAELIERLKKDGETSLENLRILEKALKNDN